MLLNEVSSTLLGSIRTSLRSKGVLLSNKEQMMVLRQTVFRCPSPGDKQVRHPREVAGYGLASCTLAQGQGKAGLCLHSLEDTGLDHAAQRNARRDRVGDFDAHQGLPGYRCLDADGGSGQGER